MLNIHCDFFFSIAVECEGKPHRFLQDTECENSKVEEREGVFMFDSPEISKNKPSERLEEINLDNVPLKVAIDTDDVCDETMATGRETINLANVVTEVETDSVNKQSGVESSMNDGNAGGAMLNGVDVKDTSVNGCVSRISTSAPMKPPNVLVYCGKKDSVRRFQGVKASLEQCLNTDCYTIYHLQHTEVSSVPWADNSALLVVSCENLYDGVDLTFVKYFQNGGQILSCGSSLDGEFVEKRKVQNRIGVTEINIEDWKGVSTLRGPYNYCGGVKRMGDLVMNSMASDPATGESVLMSVRQRSAAAGGMTGVVVLSQVSHFSPRARCDLSA